MTEAIRRLLGQDFMPHGMCYLWQPGLIWVHVISDSLIAMAYCVIPATLIYFVRRRRDIPFHWMFLCFGVFIVSCGATHAMEVWTIWHGSYWLSGGIKAVTAAASVPTAFLLVRLVPAALKIPSRSQLESANEQLRLEVAARKKSEEELAFHAKEVERLSRDLLHVQEHERRKVAREVHDSLGQYMAGLSLGLGRLSADTTSPNHGQIVSELCEMVHAASAEIRNISYFLYPPMLDELGLEFALKWLVRTQAESTGVRITLEVPPGLRRLEPAVELALFRLAQECLTNVCRHSGSPCATVRLTQTGSEMTLEVMDQGKGMPPISEGATGESGLGIRGMKERVRELDGTIEIETVASGGVTIRATVPVSRPFAEPVTPD